MGVLFKKLKDRYKNWIAKQNDKLFGTRCDTCAVTNLKFNPTITYQPRDIITFEATKIIDLYEKHYLPEKFFTSGTLSEEYVRILKKEFLNNISDRLIECIDWKYLDDPLSVNTEVHFRLYVGRR